MLKFPNVSQNRAHKYLNQLFSPTLHKYFANFQCGNLTIKIKLTSFSQYDSSNFFYFAALRCRRLFLSQPTLPSYSVVKETKVETVFGLFGQGRPKRHRQSLCFWRKERCILHRKWRGIYLLLEAWYVLHNKDITSPVCHVDVNFSLVLIVLMSNIRVNSLSNQ